MIAILILCCACDYRQAWPTITPTRITPEITMPAGKDFDCWTAEPPTISESSKPENILIIGWEGDLFHFSLSKGTTEEITLPGEVRYPPVSPNGQYVFYEGKAHDYYVYDRLKMTHQKILIFANLDQDWKQWSKDSQCLLVSADKKEFAYRIADNTVQEKDRTVILEEGMVRWALKSPNGKFAAWKCQDLQRICLSKADGQSINHPALELDTVVEKYAMVSLYGWSADSRMLLFGFSTGQELMAGYINTLRLVFMDENGVQKYTDFHSYSSAIWAPDGKSILMLMGSKEFDIYEISTENSKKLIPPRGYSDEMMTWLPDSKQIIFVSENHKSLYRLDIDRGDFVKLDADMGYIKEMFLVP
jgi:hypothetical protein